MYTIGGTLMHADKDGNMLMHSAKGTEWKNHKYVDKVRKGGKWVYSYTKKAGGAIFEKITGKNAKAKRDKTKKRYEDAKTVADRSLNTANNLYNMTDHYEMIRNANDRLSSLKGQLEKEKHLAEIFGPNATDSNGGIIGNQINMLEDKIKEQEDVIAMYNRRIDEDIKTADKNNSRAWESHEKAEKQKNNAASKYSAAEKAYDKTLAGQLENLVEWVDKKKKKK